MITKRNEVFFRISSIVLGLIDQLQVLPQMYLIELLVLLTGLYHRLYSRLLAGVSMLMFFTNQIVMEFQVRYLSLFLLFSVIDDFKWFCMRILHKIIQFLLEFLKAPFLVLHVSCSTLMTFLGVLSVILVAILMILLAVISVNRHLINGNN